jgi:hypothetical protein
MPHVLPRIAIGTLTLCCLLAIPLSAHVHLDSPNGGESFGPGESVLVTWTVAVGHNTVGWKLEYSLNGAAGPWLPIDMNIAPGDISTGAVHNYLWTAPLLTSENVRIRVTQDNTGTDWNDVSASDFAIGAEFSASAYEISVASGGLISMNLDAGSSLAGETYIVAGSISGSMPGQLYQGNVIPLNPDFYFSQSIATPNQSPFSNSLGSLSASGTAQTLFALSAGVLPPSAVGVVLTHAAAVLDASSNLLFVSPPIPLALVP